MTPIDSLLAAKKALAASEVAELGGDYRTSIYRANDAVLALEDWIRTINKEWAVQRNLGLDTWQ